MYTNSKAVRPGSIITYSILFFGIGVIVFPFLWMVLSSFKTLQEIVAFPPTFFPEKPTIENYVEVWTKINFSLFFRNSLYIVAIKTVIILYTSTLAGYVLGKLQFKGRDTVFACILATMMIPWPVTVLSLYQQMVWMKLIDTYFSLILPSIFYTFGIFMMRQFISGIPDSLVESARMDGAGEFRLLHVIIIPLLGPALSALGIFSFLTVWDDFLWPFLMLNSESKYTIPVGLALFKGRYWTDYSKQLTGATITVIPVMVVYFFLQRQFVEGITMTGIKG